MSGITTLQIRKQISITCVFNMGDRMQIFKTGFWPFWWFLLFSVRNNIEEMDWRLTSMNKISKIYDVHHEQLLIAWRNENAQKKKWSISIIHKRSMHDMKSRKWSQTSSCPNIHSRCKLGEGADYRRIFSNQILCSSFTFIFPVTWRIAICKIKKTTNLSKLLSDRIHQPNQFEILFSTLLVIL